MFSQMTRPGEALEQGVHAGVQVPGGPQGPQVQAKAHHTQIEGDEYGQKDRCGGDGTAPGEGDQIEQVADPGGQQKIGQQHRPEGGLGRAHIRPGPALEFFAVDFHGFLRCNV